MPAIAPADLDEFLSSLISSGIGSEGILLPVLHGLQGEYGYVPSDAVPVLASRLGLSRAEVEGVVSFYHDFRDSPGAGAVVRICRGEACQAVGGEALAEAARSRLGVDWHGTSVRGPVRLEPVFCLGLCACGPAAQVDGRLHGRVSPSRLAELLGELSPELAPELAPGLSSGVASAAVSEAGA